MDNLFNDLPEVEYVYFTDDWIIKSRKTNEVKYTGKSLEDAKQWCFNQGAWLVKNEGTQYTSLIEIAKNE